MKNGALWIAFIFQYLWDTKQHSRNCLFHTFRCELLSFFSIFGIQNNIWIFDKCFCDVVNCFHFSVSLGYKTTESLDGTYSSVLWIAFIFQYLWDTKQPISKVLSSILCCELLSFFSIFGIQNNKRISKWKFFELWIAFIFQYLWDTKQQQFYFVVQQIRCELLSFFSIFGIQNNKT